MFFSEKIKPNNSVKKQISIDAAYSICVYETAHETICEDWDEVLKDRNLFLSLSYLEILEEKNSTRFKPIYVIVYKQKVPVGIVYFQSIDFEAGVFGKLLESQLKQLQAGRSGLFEKYIRKNRQEVLMRLLTCGNNFISGEHAFIFKNHINKKLEIELLEKVIDKISSKEKLRGKISAVLVKDFYRPVPVNSNQCFFGNRKFIEFNVEPNMLVDIPDYVNSLNEYVSLFSKKYRNRAKSVLAGRTNFKIKELTLSDLEKETYNLYKLYEQVFEKAKFKLVKLKKDYLINCKKQFEDSFFVYGFYQEAQLIAFCSGFVLNKNYLEAHYIGFDYELNKTLDLYQNILYKFIECAIEKKTKELNLGRTAGEIKSTVGAKAHDLTCYIKPHNTLSKMVLKPFIGFLQPAKWIPRNPFKESTDSHE